MDIDNRSVRSGNYHTLTLVTPVADPKEPTDYNTLINKPSINGVELVGNMTLDDIGISSYEDVPKTSITPEEIDQIIEQI